MKISPILSSGLLVASIGFNTSVAMGQNSIQVFSPVNVRASAQGTGYGTSAVAFNSTIVNLNCSASPITALISSTPDSKGNVLVDNNIQLSVTSATSTVAPVNVCRGGTTDSTPDGPAPDCFTSSYRSAASAGQLTGQDPDSFVATGGVAPIDVHSSLQSGAQQLTINLVDTGGLLASSTVYLNTNCSPTGVAGGAEITGNPIPQTNPTPPQLTQSFSFNPTTNQKVRFVYDLSQAQAAGSLTITDNTIPGSGDQAVDSTTFQPSYVANTSFATSSCFIHTGEVLNGAPACKLFTLECTVGTGADESGAQCPVSSLPNEVFQDIFDGPSFTLPDIATPNGPTFHQGVGFLMASENWTGGPCMFDPASGLQNLPCPQNLLATFSGPGVYTASGHTTHPNSTFIAVAQVPEDLTTVTVQNQQPGGWIHSSSASLTLSSQPPVLTGTNLPGSTAFVPAPIQSITYGISAAGSVPIPGTSISTDTTVENSIGCPSPANPLDPLATVFTTAPQPLSGLADGNHLLHYFAQDCAGTEELHFIQDPQGNWSTNYYTFPINVDTIAPIVSSGPTLSPLPGMQASYAVGQSVAATYSCTDERSGVIRCGSSNFSYTAMVLSTGPITSPVDTSTPGAKSYTVTAVDAAGNQSSTSVNYVVAAYDSAIQLTLGHSTVTYPQGTNVVVRVTPSYGRVPTGLVQLYDGQRLLQTSDLEGDGAAYLYIQGLSAGAHALSAVYAGDNFNAGGKSAPVTLQVNPVPVRLSMSCWNASFPYGASYHCGIYTSSDAGPPQGVVTYQYDGGASVTLPLQHGNAQLVISEPLVGRHRVTVQYAAQTNYAAAEPSTQSFVVTPAPVILQLTPSSWYLTGGNLTLSASLQSWSAGPPDQLGTIVFRDGNKVLATVPVSAGGTATTTLAASSLSNGRHTFVATYSGSKNYAAASGSATVTVAVP